MVKIMPLLSAFGNSVIISIAGRAFCSVFIETNTTVHTWKPASRSVVPRSVRKKRLSKLQLPIAGDAHRASNLFSDDFPTEGSERVALFFG